tara:strand:- start:156155 stop:158947 length:2793 start_codon:yes stop_codon:yes gene_type:complete
MFNRIKESAAGRCSEIIAALTPLPADYVTKGRTDHPCPLCNSKSTLWPDDRDGGANQHGRLSCRNCTDNKPTGDIIDTVRVFGGQASQGEAARLIADHLGLSVSQTADAPPKIDIIEQVAKAKRMPVDAFRRFGAEEAKRGRDKKPVARVPVYNERGEIHSHFDVTPTDKGFFKRGAGMSGLFLPGRLPAAGETWLLVEGVKDAAALLGLGYNACGLPGSSMARKYAGLFKGCHIITVADLDEVGQSGAVRTGGNLSGIAASIKAARLPGEIVATKGDDVRDVIRRDGDDAVRKAIENATAWQPREGELRNDDRPEVILTLRYAWHCDQVTQHVGRLGWKTPWIPEPKREARKIYQRGGMLVHVIEETKPDATSKGGKVSIAKGTPRIRPLPVPQLKLRVADACQLIVEKETGDGDFEKQAVPPPNWLTDGIHTAGDYGDAVRSLDGIITAPTIRVDGSILQQPGWDAKTGLLFRPSMKFQPVPEKPSESDAKAAANRLLEVVSDFPFTDEADQSAWLSMVLSMIGRSCVAGCVPMFTITANIRGAGKSLLVDAASIIAYGHTAARTTYTSEDDEMRKRITSIVMEGAPAVLLDNIDRPIGGAAIDAVLTAERWKDRELGQSRNIDLPAKAVWTATGNNLSFRTDVARRVLPIRLDSPEECPEDRTDFAHADLLGWTRENRAKLVTAALTVLRAYFVAGCPKQPDGQFGSFESWSDVIRGSIVWAGLADPMTTRETAREDDQSAAVVNGLIAGLLLADERGDGLTCSGIVKELNKPEPLERYETLGTVVTEMIGKPDTRRLANQLKKYKGRVSNGFRLASRSGHGGVLRWTAEQILDGGSGGSGGSTFTDLYAQESCVFPHTHSSHSSDTYTHTKGAAVKQESPESPDPPLTCEQCGASMVASPAEPGWITWDCPECGAVKPEQIDKASA